MKYVYRFHYEGNVHAGLEADKALSPREAWAYGRRLDRGALLSVTEEVRQESELPRPERRLWLPHERPDGPLVPLSQARPGEPVWVGNVHFGNGRSAVVAEGWCRYLHSAGGLVCLYSLVNCLDWSGVNAEATHCVRLEGDDGLFLQ